MNSTARERIFSKLYSASDKGAALFPPPKVPRATPLNQSEKVARLKELMEEVRSEVHLVKAKDWVRKLRGILRSRDLHTLLYAPGTIIGDILEKSWKNNSEGMPRLKAYTKDVENFKEELFNIDAGITSTIGGIAETGALILWPDEKEPRLLSLIPPVHIAVLEADKIYDTFLEAVQKEKWACGMPTNALLISGPSKTADIEFTLAFGVHGPKELIVLILIN